MCTYFLYGWSARSQAGQINVINTWDRLNKMAATMDTVVKAIRANKLVAMVINTWPWVV